MRAGPHLYDIADALLDGAPKEKSAARQFAFAQASGGRGLDPVPAACTGEATHGQADGRPRIFVGSVESSNTSE